jgi:hypothetical protein
MRVRQYLRRLARGLMLVAVAAFLQQGAMVAVSQAVAAAGSMPQPAVTLRGAVHLHDGLVAYVHIHGGENGAGHVHGAPDSDHDTDEAGITPFWSLGCPLAVLSAIAACALSFDLVGAIEPLPGDHLDGIEPDGLQRPPSTPSIA